MVEINYHRKWIITLLFVINGAYFLSKHRSAHYSIAKQGLLGFEIPEVICFSPSRMALPLEQLCFSAAFIVLICIISHNLRKIIEEHISDPLIRILLQEAVAAADLCGCGFELIIVSDNYGVWVYGLYLFLLTIWWAEDWGDANACPNVQIEDVIMGKQDTQLCLMKIWAQLTGGIFVYKFIQCIWSMELIENHENRATEDCTADLQVCVWHGFLVEGGGTFLSQLATKFISEMEPKYGSIINSFIGTALVIAAFDWTGGYFNPALATGLKYGCKGNTFKEHILVYWVGACVGSVLSILVFYHTPLVDIAQKLGGSESRPEVDNDRRCKHHQE